ncbi:hypothetical protein TorRG33x02_328550 [Trema orientale]|uniref:Uncharacterized protein n=1 Tax=Trema orientale TaxID=63057 RepID=A0A2P5B9K1_TREOI|nr:hypothetical protein TorRG33x02_328550 [Trema orientale]
MIILWDLDDFGEYDLGLIWEFDLGLMNF